MHIDGCAMALTKRCIEARIQALTHMLRAAGLRLTHQRLEICGEIARTDKHPEVETIYDRVRARVPSVSLDTVYRTLALLERRGLISRVEMLSGPTRYDANTERHHHFVCTECGLVRDVRALETDELPNPSCARELGTVRSIHVQFRGVCSKCAARKRRKRASG
jgi:Fur family peroxide stress response transcriptional regulator